LSARAAGCLLLAAALIPSPAGRATAISASCGKLLAPPSGAYLGAFNNFDAPDYTSDEDVVTTDKIDQFEQEAGRKLVWVYFTQHWFKGLEFPLQTVLLIWRHEEIPFVRLQPHSGFFYGNGPPQQYPEQHFSLQHIIDGQFDPQLRAWADEARNTNIPILAEFGTEIEDAWGPWSAVWNGAGRTDGYGDPSYPDGAERYRDAYRHIVTLFRQEGATNVTWFIHFAGFHYSDWWNDPKWYYPGDDYIDWLGISNYGSVNTIDPEIPFSTPLDADGYYNELTSFSKRPLAVLELGVTDNAAHGKPAWIRDAFDTIKSGRFPRIHAVSWWNTGAFPPPNINTRIDSSPDALNALRESVADPFFAQQPQFSGDCRPPTPGSLSAHKKGDLIRLAWKGSLSATRYEVWRDSKPLLTTDATAALIRRPRRGHSFAYAVRAANPVGVSGFSTRIVVHH
jgi:Glycosyl hydrolase family 26